MRILFISQTHLRKDLGAAKVLIELAEEMERVGWRCDLESLPNLVGETYDPREAATIREALRGYLLEHADKYDVVDYDHVYLPYRRAEFSPRTLLVARSILLHREDNPVPADRSWRSKARSLLFGSPAESVYREVVRLTRATVAEADLVNVANHDDEAELIQWGIARDKVVVLPYGLSRKRQLLFARSLTVPPQSDVVGFIGTFDQRKGAADFPALVRDTCLRLPKTSFLLLGTGRSESEVLSGFPRTFWSRIRVVPAYDPDQLPDLLETCSIGVFPSYLESFGFGVLEMLAAAIPVVAYDCPGPPMMLPAEYLVPRGDTKAMSEKVVGLLQDRVALAAARVWAKERATAFSWAEIANRTGEIYTARFQQRAKKLKDQGVSSSSSSPSGS